ncbi:hypothetical protein K0M31_001981 [Melipona bicolor]|uniref:Uncharacterized protein n=1 Tax=Melipona bicolor TaxID=60889 RepID=A0AA40GGM6_9HYME|nr:hypothetical protein K0M31_001981 [Melipona bicolor]
MNAVPSNKSNVTNQRITTNRINHLLKIFNCIWQHQVFPDNWRKTIVISIPKPEKIINRWLRWFLESNNILSPNSNMDLGSTG